MMMEIYFVFRFPKVRTEGTMRSSLPVFQCWTSTQSQTTFLIPRQRSKREKVSDSRKKAFFSFLGTYSVSQESHLLGKLNSPLSKMTRINLRKAHRLPPALLMRGSRGRRKLLAALWGFRYFLWMNKSLTPQNCLMPFLWIQHRTANRKPLIRWSKFLDLTLWAWVVVLINWRTWKRCSLFLLTDPRWHRCVYSLNVPGLLCPFSGLLTSYWR